MVDVITYEVDCPDDMTIGAHRELERLLNEHGATKMHDDDVGFTVTVKIADVAGAIGDVGPAMWARYAAGLSEDSDMPEAAAAMLTACALDDWWGDLKPEIERLGAHAHGPEVPLHA